MTAATSFVGAQASRSVANTSAAAVPAAGAGGQPAARVGDPVGAHSRAGLGAVLGGILGFAIGAIGVALAAAAIVLTAGMAAPIVAGAYIGLAAAGAGLVASTAQGVSTGAKVGKTSNSGSPCCSITTGSPNVNIEGKPAARANVDKVSHGRPEPTISSGAAWVLVNNEPLVREGEEGGCGGIIITSCAQRTFIGGESNKKGGSDSLVSTADAIAGFFGKAALVLAGAAVLVPAFAAGTILGGLAIAGKGAMVLAAGFGLGWAGGKAGGAIGAAADRAGGRTDGRYEMIGSDVGGAAAGFLNPAKAGAVIGRKAPVQDLLVSPKDIKTGTQYLTTGAQAPNGTTRSLAGDLRGAAGWGRAAPAGDAPASPTAAPSDPRILREVPAGASRQEVDAIVSAHTRETGNEAAVVKLEDGRRVLVAGTKEEVDFSGIPVARRDGLATHTHPDGNTLPSDVDLRALQQLGQPTSRITAPDGTSRLFGVLIPENAGPINDRLYVNQTGPIVNNKVDGAYRAAFREVNGRPPTAEEMSWLGKPGYIEKHYPEIHAKTKENVMKGVIEQPSGSIDFDAQGRAVLRERAPGSPDASAAPASPVAQRPATIEDAARQAKIPSRNFDDPVDVGRVQEHMDAIQRGESPEVQLGAINGDEARPIVLRPEDRETYLAYQMLGKEPPLKQTGKKVPETSVKRFAHEEFEGSLRPGGLKLGALKAPPKGGPSRVNQPAAHVDDSPGAPSGGGCPTCSGGSKYEQIAAKIKAGEAITPREHVLYNDGRVKELLGKKTLTSPELRELHSLLGKYHKGKGQFSSATEVDGKIYKIPLAEQPVHPGGRAKISHEEGVAQYEAQKKVVDFLRGDPEVARIVPEARIAEPGVLEVDAIQGKSFKELAREKGINSPEVARARAEMDRAARLVNARLAHPDAPQTPGFVVQPDTNLGGAGGNHKFDRHGNLVEGGFFDPVSVKRNTTEPLPPLTMSDLRGRGIDRPVIVDTESIYKWNTARTKLEPGETPVITETTLKELRANAGRPDTRMPSFANEFPVIQDARHVDSYTAAGKDIQAWSTSMNTGYRETAAIRGFQGDRTNLATAREYGIPMVSGDRGVFHADTKIVRWAEQRAPLPPEAVRSAGKGVMTDGQRPGGHDCPTCAGDSVAPTVNQISHNAGSSLSTHPTQAGGALPPKLQGATLAKNGFQPIPNAPKLSAPPAAVIEELAASGINGQRVVSGDVEFVRGFSSGKFDVRGTPVGTDNPQAATPDVRRMPEPVHRYVEDFDAHVRREYGLQVESVSVRWNDAGSAGSNTAWHRDGIGQRALVTFDGPGTFIASGSHPLYREGPSYYTSIPEGYVPPPNDVVQIPPGVPVMIYGQDNPTGNAALGALHKGPNTTDRRLFMTLELAPIPKPPGS